MNPVKMFSNQDARGAGDGDRVFSNSIIVNVQRAATPATRERLAVIRLEFMRPGGPPHFDSGAWPTSHRLCEGVCVCVFVCVVPLSASVVDFYALGAQNAWAPSKFMVRNK